MRKQLRDMLLEMLPTIRDGVKHARANKTSASAVLSDCYTAVVAIADTLEHSLSSARFSHYNDNIDVIKDDLEFMLEAIVEDSPHEEISKDIKSRIRSLKNDLENEIEVKLEIVFMPYNASMWDCMESIWLAAKNDPQCDVYVVPLPYYNRNPDKSFGEKVYEGSIFPDYIPIVHYDLYDLESRHPDVIYIQNPYDEFNLVTTIHPRFYSYELKKHTDLLVYVPYFVVQETISDLYCDLSAVKLADIIVAQSETVRKSYAKFAGGKKVVALGSPKLDKIVNTKRDNQIISEEWKKLIEKPDGTRKKVVLYNTSVDSILKGDQQYLEKLRSVLSLFKNEKDAVLWWRPHPLSITTYGSMRPHLLNEYLSIVEDYVRGEWGIYDDTADMHRAIAMSDAYYGDRSSLVPLYNATGKPALLQNINIINYANAQTEVRICLFSFKVENNILWGVPKQINGLFSLNLETETLEFHGMIPNEKAYESILVSSLVVDGNDVILSPFLGKGIAKYDIGSSTYDHVLVENIGKGRFFDSCLYEGNVYMLPGNYPALVKYNVNTGRVTENRALCVELDTYRANDDDFYFRKGALINKDSLVALSGIRNIVVEYDIKNDSYKLHHVGDIENKYMHIAFDGDDYWLLTYKRSIIKWNLINETVVEIHELPSGFVNGDLYDFCCSVIFGDSIIVFPNQTNMILKIDAKTNEVESFANLNERDKHPLYSTNTSKYLHAERVGDYIYASSAYENALQKIDPRAGKIENIPLTLSDDDYYMFIDNFLFSPKSTDGYIPWQERENNVINLSLFLRELRFDAIDNNQKSLRFMSNSFVNIDGSCGVKTHDFVKSRLMRTLS